MTKFLLAVLCVVAAASPATAFYTECAVTKDTVLANRPGGLTEPRYQSVSKGDKVAFRDSYQNWWFVMHATDGGAIVDYGWLPKNVLTNCGKQEGTP